MQDDIHFVTPTCSKYGIDRDKLQQWLTAFNAKLNKHGHPLKTMPDYRKHFLSWLRFYKPAKDDPALWEELLERKTPACATASPPVRPTYEEAAAQRAAEIEYYTRLHQQQQPKL